MVDLILKVVLFLVLFLILMYCFKKASKYLQDSMYSNYNDKNMKVLERIVLTKDNGIFLIEVYGKKYFVGTSPQNISILKELDIKNDKTE